MRRLIYLLALLPLMAQANWNPNAWDCTNHDYFPGACPLVTNGLFSGKLEQTNLFVVTSPLVTNPVTCADYLWTTNAPVISTNHLFQTVACWQNPNRPTTVSSVPGNRDNITINCAKTNVAQLVGTDFTPLTNGASGFFPVASAALNLCRVWTWDLTMATNEREAVLAISPLTMIEFAVDVHKTIEFTTPVLKTWILLNAGNFCRLATNDYTGYLAVEDTNYVWQTQAGQLLWDGSNLVNGTNSWATNLTARTVPTWGDPLYLDANTNLTHQPPTPYTPAVSMNVKLCVALHLPIDLTAQVTTNWDDNSPGWFNGQILTSTFTNNAFLITNWISASDYFSYTPPLHGPGLGHVVTNNWKFFGGNDWLRYPNQTFTPVFQNVETNAYLNTWQACWLLPRDLTVFLYQEPVDTFTLNSPAFFTGGLITINLYGFYPPTDKLIDDLNRQLDAGPDVPAGTSTWPSWPPLNYVTSLSDVHTNPLTITVHTGHATTIPYYSNGWTSVSYSNWNTAFYTLQAASFTNTTTIYTNVAGYLSMVGTNWVTILSTNIQPFIATNVASVNLGVYSVDWTLTSSLTNSVTNTLFSLTLTNSLNSTNVSAAYTNYAVATGRLEGDYELDGSKTCLNALHQIPVALGWYNVETLLIDRYGTNHVSDVTDTNNLGALWPTSVTTDTLAHASASITFSNANYATAPFGASYASSAVTGYRKDMWAYSGYYQIIGTGTKVTVPGPYVCNATSGTNPCPFIEPTYCPGGGEAKPPPSSGLGTCGGGTACLFSTNTITINTYSDFLTAVGSCAAASVHDCGFPSAVNGTLSFWHGSAPPSDFSFGCIGSDGNLYAASVTWSNVSMDVTNGDAFGYGDGYSPADVVPLAVTLYQPQQVSVGIAVGICTNFTSRRDIYLQPSLPAVASSGYGNTSILPVPVSTNMDSVFVTYTPPTPSGDCTNSWNANMPTLTYYRSDTLTYPLPVITNYFYQAGSNVTQVVTNILWSTAPVFTAPSAWPGATWDAKNNLGFYQLFSTATGSTNIQGVLDFLATTPLIGSPALDNVPKSWGINNGIIILDFTGFNYHQ